MIYAGYSSSESPTGQPYLLARQPYDCHRVLWFQHATGTLAIDFMPYDLLPNSLFFVAPGQLLSLEHCAVGELFVLAFDDAFLYAQAGDADWLGRCNLLGTAAVPFVSLPPDEVAPVESLVALLLAEWQRDGSAQQTPLLRNYVKNLLFLAERVQHQQAGQRPVLTEDCALFLAFKQVLEQRVHAQRLVADYARALHITPKRLNQLVKKLVGKTAGDYILERVILEAKRRIYFEPVSIKEVAFSLGFDDPANFSRAFRSRAGTSPERFRQQAAQIDK